MLFNLFPSSEGVDGTVAHGAKCEFSGMSSKKKLHVLFYTRESKTDKLLLRD